MNVINFSIRIWAVAQLLFQGLGLLLAACSILPILLVPAFVGGLCSFLLFSLCLAGVVQFRQQRSGFLWLLSLAVLIACFVPLYLYDYLQTGRLVLWDTHSRIYPAILMAAGCGIVSILLNRRSLYRLQRQGLFAYQS